MSNLSGYIPKKLTVVKHATRDITFILPNADPEVGFLPANYDKRLITATSWAGKGCESVELENTAVSGFKFETLNGRYHTEVEYVLVRHPEGYVFEVPFQNLLDILQVAGCGVGGVVSQPCKMFATGGKWRIIPQGTSLEEESVSADKASRQFVADKKKNASKKFKEGQVVKMRDSDGYWVYLGKHKLSASYQGKHEVFNIVSTGYHGKDCEIYSQAGMEITINGSSVHVVGQKFDYKEGLCRDFTDTYTLPELEKDYLLFARIVGVSKTDTIGNAEFMLERYRKGEVKSQIIAFKSKSVQFQPTDEFDDTTLKLALSGSVEFELAGGGNVRHYDLMKGWDDNITQFTHRNMYSYSSAYPYTVLPEQNFKVGEKFKKSETDVERFYLDNVSAWVDRLYGRCSASVNPEPSFYNVIKFRPV